MAGNRPYRPLSWVRTFLFFLATGDFLAAVLCFVAASRFTGDQQFWAIVAAASCVLSSLAFLASAAVVAAIGRIEEHLSGASETAPQSRVVRPIEREIARAKLPPRQS